MEIARSITELCMGLSIYACEDKSRKNSQFLGASFNFCKFSGCSCMICRIKYFVMGLLEFGWINRNIGLHVLYGLFNVFGKPCSGFVLVSRHISIQVHISEILFSYHLACKFGMNFVLNPEPCILILFFLTDLDL
jgi:hypothetical protein